MLSDHPKRLKLAFSSTYARHQIYIGYGYAFCLVLIFCEFRSFSCFIFYFLYYLCSFQNFPFMYPNLLATIMFVMIHYFCLCILQVSCPIVKLVLRNNVLRTLRGLENLKLVEGLDLSCNLISSFSEMEILANLPCLQNLWLEGNPICYARWYRAYVFSFFSHPERVSWSLLQEINHTCSLIEISVS